MPNSASADRPTQPPVDAALRVRQAVRRSLTRGPVLVACSGGADSLALLAAAVAESVSLDLTVVAVVIDHGLQPGSAEVAAGVVTAAHDLGAAAECVRVEVGTRGGPEAAARDARYAALEAAAGRHGAPTVLLGHTRDDQAESVLLGLARGSGARSLAGMRGETTRGAVAFVRPLLGLERGLTRAACAELGLSPWEDPHNTDPAYTRARVRADLMPVLVDVLGPGAIPALARTADLLRDDADALDGWADRVLAGLDPSDLDVGALVDLPAAVRRRVLRGCALAAGVPAGSLTAAHLESLDALVARWRGQGAVALPGPVAAGRGCGRLTFRGL